ncbi:hypothetical protein CLPU_12c00090 [Gottschalkia purinilytica]|uniref:Uncharacterized protein n=1 Tax=Gottschalkia purinilytica TaxID=1503 RepID=A0A0L0W8G0_GOTPU|nr:CD3072 family TudS-related putative desulfidase [Gottschalkia purinilytica]KNF07736.1 hypothetical protein CLPU_12c00090 [Gottschalkia purinilytica]
MKKRSKMVLVSHCILNPCSKVEGVKKDTSYNLKLVKYFMKNDIGIIQLPCPEMYMYGSKRWGHVKNQFDTRFFREQSKELLNPLISQITDYVENDYEIIGVIGINGSPSCGINKVCTGETWGGEFRNLDIVNRKVKELVYSDGSGVFMEVLMESLRYYDIDVPFYPIEEFNPDDMINETISRII